MRLRLVKVIVQPVYVWDDGESLNEVKVQPVEVIPTDWPAYPARLLQEAREYEEAQLAGGEGAQSQPLITVVANGGAVNSQGKRPRSRPARK